MTTKGCIARGLENNTWVGIYHHFDSYPTALGHTLWKNLHEQYNNDVEKFLHDVVDEHPAGWVTYVGSRFEYSASDNDWVASDELNRACFCHGPYYDDYEEGVDELHSWDTRPLWLDWIYIFYPGMLVIYKQKIVKELTGHEASIYNAPGGYYVHDLVGLYELDGEEPNWEEMISKAEEINVD